MCYYRVSQKKVSQSQMFVTEFVGSSLERSDVTDPEISRGYLLF